MGWSLYFINISVLLMIDLVVKTFMLVGLMLIMRMRKVMILMRLMR